MYIQTHTRTAKYVWVYRHPMSIYHYLFSKYMVVEVSQVSDDQKQALVNAVQYVRNPTRKIYAYIPT